MIREINPDALAQAQRQACVLVDVRQPEEYQAGHVPGALSIPLGVLPARSHELPRNEPLYLICQAGGRSRQAAEFLDGQGFHVTDVLGGTHAWTASGNPVVTGPNPG